MGAMEKIRKIIKRYLCCGGEKEVKKIYDEISQIDNNNI
jgi:hypothetical protein